MVLFQRLKKEFIKQKTSKNKFFQEGEKVIELNKPINKEYKYCHLLSGKATNFHKCLIDVLSCEENDLEKDEHLFITVNATAYDDLKNLGNVAFVKGANHLTANIINQCAKICKWLFIHNLACSPIEVLKINKSLRKKIIWRTWGSDAGIELEIGSPIKKILKRVINVYYKRVIKDFYAVGIANAVDKIDISSRYPGIKTFFVPYVNKSACETRLQYKPSPKKEGSPINVLIGHSGFPNDNHIKIIKDLSKFRDENIRLYLVLSYGDSEYIKRVVDIAKKTFGDKAIIIDEYMPYDEYFKMLSKMDIGVLDGVKSYALGNLGALLFLKKKIVLNRDGIIKKAFDSENVPHLCSDEIGSLTFEEFSQPITYTNKNSIQYKEYSDYVENWKFLLDELSR